MKLTYAAMGKIRITSADIPSILALINAEGIRLYDVTFADEITVCVAVRGKDYKELKRLLTDRQVSFTVVNQNALQWNRKSIRGRSILIVGCFLLVMLALFLPSRIFFVRVEGNESIPDKLILEQAQVCGIRFGASRRVVRSEKMKNALLESIPQLQWAGVNTAGCVATISVREKSAVQEEQNEAAGISSIVAVRDGVIVDFTVINGNPLCQVGQAVKAGQTLISGYSDCGIILKATRAEGEVYAQTLHQAQVLTPANCTVRGEEIERETRYSLLVGKKLINFYKDSGISDSTCVKMYSQKYLILPGGFSLPVALIKQTQIRYAVEADVQTDTESVDWLSSYAQDYLCSQMIAGRIDSAENALWSSDGVIGLTGRYLCTEMIGRTKHEQIIQGDAKVD